MKMRTGVIYLLMAVLISLTACSDKPTASGELAFAPLSDKELTDTLDLKALPAGMLTEGNEVLRRQYSRLNYAFFDKYVVSGKPDDSPVTLQLFDDVRLSLRTSDLQKNENGVYTWLAQSDDKSYIQANISFNEHSAFGTVQVDNRIYEIMPIKDKIVVITEYDQSRFPPEAPPITPVKKAPQSRNIQGKDMIAKPPSLADGKQNLKVLLVLPNTYKIFCKSNWFPFNPLALIATSYQSNLNKVYSAVQSTDVSATVVAACADYNAVGGDLTADLDWVRTNASVATLRDNHQADLVSLIVPSSSYCGRGYYNYPVAANDDAWAFSVVKASCALGNYSFAHELGHNVGMQHDRATDNGSTSDLCNYGSVFPFKVISMKQKMRSVMTYGSACSNCTRIGVYSNPMTLDFGAISIGPMGAACSTPPSGGNYTRANNRQQLIDSAPVVSNFR